jgi:V/A-type H+-transporting ATPase subunit E
VGLEEIVGRINQEAAEQAAKIQAEASAEASKIIEDAKARAEALVSAARTRAEKQVRDERMRSIASARLAARRELLRAREDVLQHYERQIMEEVDDFVKSDDYPKFLARMIEDGLSKIGKEAKIQVNANDRALLKGKRLGGEISKDELKCKGGALVTSPDGKRRVDNTIESLLRERGDAIRLKLIDLVFADGPNKGG